MPTDGSMRTSTGYDAPADGYIYHLTGTWKPHWTQTLSSQHAANHVSVGVEAR